MCGLPSTNPSPIYQENKFELNKLCLKSFVKAFKKDKPKMIFLCDFCGDGYKEMISEIVPFEHEVNFTNLGINDTMLKAYEIAKDQDDDILFQECDYLYLHNTGFKEGLDTLDLISPYDHLNFYLDPTLHSDQVILKLVGDTHWRTTERNTMTFAVKNKIFKDNYDIFYKYGYLDSDVWYDLLTKGYPLWVPIPSMATHMAKDYLAPLGKLGEVMEHSVIILIYHRTKELAEMGQDCLASVLNTIDPKTTEVIVVDNGSTVKSDWSKAKYIDLKENKGISAGWNAGIKAAKGEYITILGDDTIVHGNWLEELEKCFKEPRCGVANLHMEHLPHGEGIKEEYKWYSGACFMLSRETIKKVGLFDEKIWPCNWEDVDYWLRVYKAGLKLYKNFTISIQHREGATLHAPDLASHFNKNKEYVIKKHGFDPTGVFYGIDSIYKRLDNP